MMLLDVSADDFRRDLVSHCTSKIAIFPEFSTPQAPPDLWELAKDGAGAHTLAPGHHLGNRVPRREGAKNMDMVGTDLHFLNGDVLLLGNIGKEFLHPLLDLALQHVAPVLGRPHQVVQSIVDSMGCSAEDHAAIVRPSSSVWQRALSPLPNTLIPPRRKQRGA
jgi:hypothetical protein